MTKKKQDNEEQTARETRERETAERQYNEEQTARETREREIAQQLNDCLLPAVRPIPPTAY